MDRFIIKTHKLDDDNESSVAGTSSGSITHSTKLKTKLRGLQSASELYRPSDRRLLAKLVPTFADRGCRVVSAMEPPAVNLALLTGAATFSFK
jgi:hypothetical protein